MTKPQMRAAMLAQLNELREPGGYYNAGTPNYDHLFGRDACVSALQMLHADPAPARATLEILAYYQGKRQFLTSEEYPGRILHEHFVGGLREQLHSLLFNGERARQLFALTFWHFPYYGSVDSGAWYLILLHNYYRKTGDTVFLSQMWPVVEGIMEWTRKHATHSHTGLVGFKRHYIFGLRNQSWKDTINVEIKPPVAMIEVQGYYYYGLTIMADLAEEVMNRPDQADDWRSRAAKLKTAFDTCFVPRDGLYPMAVNGRGKPVYCASSNQGQLLFSGILSKVDSAALVKRLFQDDFWTPYGLRNESMTEPTFNPSSYQNGSIWPFDNWVIEQGLRKSGFDAQADQIKTAITGVFEQWGNLPELYAVERDGRLHGIESSCRIQAWSAGALINFLDDAPVM